MSTLSKIAVLGAGGQVGRAYLALLAQDPAATEILPVSRRDADLNQPKSCVDYLHAHKPTTVINAAAFTQVDLAETETAAARRVNAESPGLIARWCAEQGVPLVHFSTDYVFPGTGTRPWAETDPIEPLSHYGQTKAEGEQLITQAGGQYLIFRTSWVYDAYGKNFLNTMLKLGRERETLRIVRDQVGAPTYAPNLARGSFDALKHALAGKAFVTDSGFPSGIYHLVNTGETTWYDFAQAIFERARKSGMPLQVKTVEAILSSEFPTPARRPLNSRMNTDLASATFGVRLPSWQEGLTQCLNELFKRSLEKQ